MTIGNILYQIGYLLNLVIPVLLSLGLVYFIWGVVTYVIGDNEEAKKAGRDRIIFGVIGLAVIVGVWGLVFLVVNTFGLYGSGQIASDFISGNGSIIARSAVDKKSGFCNLVATNAKIGDLFNYGTCVLIQSVVPLLFAVAIVMFIWGVVQFFIIGAGEEAKREQGKQFMIWGILALAVMVSVWGLVRILGDSFSIDTTYFPQVKSSP